MSTHDVHARNKAALAPLRAAQYNYEAEAVRAALGQVFRPDAVVHLATPFEDLDGPQGLYQQAYLPLQQALPDLERRDTIVMAGRQPAGARLGGLLRLLYRHLCAALAGHPAHRAPGGDALS